MKSLKFNKIKYISKRYYKTVIGVSNGDGIGLETVPVAKKVLEIVSKKNKIDIEFKNVPIGFEGINTKGYDSPISERAIEELRSCNAFILGPHDSVSYPKEFQSKRNPSGELRIRFDLFTNLRPAFTLPNVKSVFAKSNEIDLVVVRENTEGFYSDRNFHKGHGEFLVVPGVGISMGVFTHKAIDRITREAFEVCSKRNKQRKLTVVHKANVLKDTSGMYPVIAKKLKEELGSDLILEDYHVDAFFAKLIKNPHSFDTIVCENMFGDIISDLACEMVGSLGLGGAINYSNTMCMAQASHGSAPDIAGKNLANPTSMVLSVQLMCDWLSRKDTPQSKQWEACSKTIYDAVVETYKNASKNVLTRDIEGCTGNTRDFSNLLFTKLEEIN